MQKVLAKNRFLGYTLGMTKHYQVLVHYPKSKCTDSIIINSYGIRYAIEDAAAMIRKQYPSMAEGCDYEIVSVEKLDDKK